MVFGLFRHSRTPEVFPVMSEPAPVRSEDVTLDGLTSDGRLVGTVTFRPGSRLSDALNAREPLPAHNVRCASRYAPTQFVTDPTIESLDPYGFLLVFAGPDSAPVRSPAEASAHKIRKLSYRVDLDVGHLRVRGTIWLYPGVVPDQLVAERFTSLYLPVTEAEVWDDEQRIEPGGPVVVLVNRYELKAVRNI